MKKHLIGLGIFSFIVVSFAVAFAFLYTKPELGNLEVTKKPVVQTDKRKSCDYTKKRNVDSAFTFSQATLQRKNSHFNAIVEGENLEDLKFKFHFFVDSGKKIKYVSTENLTVRKIYSSEKLQWSVSTNLSDLLDKYDGKGNFYFIPEQISDSNQSNNKQVSFDAKKAVSVLWIGSPVVEKTVKSLDDSKILY